MGNNLTNDVLEYQKTGRNWESIRKRIYLFVYNYPQKWTNWDEDRCADFFLAFLPKIPGIVRRYKPQYQFESYLTNALQWFVKTFVGKMANAEYHESYALKEFTNQALEVGERAGDEFGGQCRETGEELDAEDCPFPLDNNGRLADIGLRRRVLYVALHRAADIDDSRLCLLARLTGVSAEWILQKAADSRHITRKNVERREQLRQRRNECWYLHHRAANRARQSSKPDQYENWKRKSDTWLTRYHTAKRSIDRISVTPSHAEIGEMVGSPAGTVSSGFFFLRRVWKHMERTGNPPDYIMSAKGSAELDRQSAHR